MFKGHCIVYKLKQNKMAKKTGWVYNENKIIERFVVKESINCLIKYHPLTTLIVEEYFKSFGANYDRLNLFHIDELFFKITENHVIISYEGTQLATLNNVLFEDTIKRLNDIKKEIL